MAQSANYYVYEHWRPDKDVCFYVGKGNGIRANNMSKRNPHHKAIQNKLAQMGLAVEVRIVLGGLTEEKAFSLEKERILFWLNCGLKLTNKTKGGEGISGYVYTPEQKAKKSFISKAVGNKPPILRGELNGFFGKTHTKETLEKLSIAAKNRKFSEETRKKLSESAKFRGVKPPRMVGKDHPNYGRKMSDEQKAKMSRTKRENNLKRKAELCHL